MDSTRQQKIARQIQKDLSEILLKEAAPIVRGALVSVTLVRVTPDLGLAKVYLSIFPFEKNKEIMEKISENVSLFRRELGNRVKNQFRIVPELAFYLDDSLEYIENIDNLLK